MNYECVFFVYKSTELRSELCRISQFLPIIVKMTQSVKNKNGEKKAYLVKKSVLWYLDFGGFMVTILVSGQYRTWNSYREINVWKFCRKAFVSGLSNAVEDEKFDKMEVKVNGKQIHSFKILNDKIYFKSILRPKIEIVKKRYLFGLIKFYRLASTPRLFQLSIKITYKDLEGPVYS